MNKYYLLSFLTVLLCYSGLTSGNLNETSSSDLERVFEKEYPNIPIDISNLTLPELEKLKNAIHEFQSSHQLFEEEDEQMDLGLFLLNISKNSFLAFFPLFWFAYEISDSFLQRFIPNAYYLPVTALMLTVVPLPTALTLLFGSKTFKMYLILTYLEGLEKLVNEKMASFTNTKPLGQPKAQEYPGPLWPYVEKWFEKQETY